ncbi:hypothetical protein ACQKIY_01390 [Bacillus mycoides]|uniref:hypothetical protein n=1 Tax=Bacillus mycoides TaxID=1405 RepID=UPI003CFEA590
MESIKYIAIGSRGIMKNNINVYIGVVAHRHQPNKTGCPQNEIPKLKYSISHYLHGESPVALK